MLYIQQSLAEDERLIHVARFHWMYNLVAFFNVIFFLGISIGIILLAIKVEPFIFKHSVMNQLDLVGQIKMLHPGMKIVAVMIFCLGLLKFAQMMIIRAATEIAVTTHRLSYKRGLVARYVGEINVDRIEGVNVLQGALGRIFGYGRVMIRGTGVGDILLPPIEQPIRFRKAVEKARNENRKNGKE